MPIYAFRCADCGHHFDRLQKLSDPDPSACPDCGAEGGVRRQLTAPAFRLAGSGWYETDFKKDGDRKRNLAVSEGGEGAKAGDDAKGGEGTKTGEAASDKASGSSAEKPAQSKADAKPSAQPAPKAAPSKPAD